MQRIGRFELAHHGTLFLDEVGDIPLELQPKLLRVLQEQEFERLGSTRTLHVDVRLVAATNQDLVKMVKGRGVSRRSVLPAQCLPDRHAAASRTGAKTFPCSCAISFSRWPSAWGRHIETIQSETMEALVRYSWPGNIRELQNIIERAVILSSGTVLRCRCGELQASANTHGKTPQTMIEAERRHILQALEETHWVVGGPRGAAARLGMKRSTLQFRMQKLRYRPPALTGCTRPLFVQEVSTGHPLYSESV